MDEIESIGVIKNCMYELGIEPNEHPLTTVSAQFIDNMNRTRGNVKVTFHYNPVDGPHISFDNVIKGFGINFQTFKPRYYGFSFSQSKKQLTIIDNNTGSGLCFSLVFS